MRYAFVFVLFGSSLFCSFRLFLTFLLLFLFFFLFFISFFLEPIFYFPQVTLWHHSTNIVFSYGQGVHTHGICLYRHPSAFLPFATIALTSLWTTNDTIYYVCMVALRHLCQVLISDVGLQSIIGLWKVCPCQVSSPQ
jgi:hypothetical protein